MVEVGKRIHILILTAAITTFLVLISWKHQIKLIGTKVPGDFQSNRTMIKVTKKIGEFEKISRRADSLELLWNLPGFDYLYERSQEVFDQALLEIGDLTRLEEFYLKAAEGREIRILALGGSVTAKNFSHIHQLDRLFNKRFPNGIHHFTNAGVGGSGSWYFRYCLFNILKEKIPCDDITELKFDLVILDFCHNDFGNFEANSIMFSESVVAEHFESLFYNLEKMGNPAFISLIFTQYHPTRHQTKPNFESLHLSIAKRMGIPTLGFAQVLDAIMGKGSVKKTRSYLLDAVHPTFLGYEIAADLLMILIEKAGEKLKERRSINKVPSLPPPIRVENPDGVPLCLTKLYCPPGNALQVLSKEDWFEDARNFEPRATGGMLKLKVCISMRGKLGLITTKSWDEKRQCLLSVRLDRNTPWIETNGTIKRFTIPMPDEDMFGVSSDPGCHILELKARTPKGKLYAIILKPSKEED